MSRYFRRRKKQDAGLESQKIPVLKQLEGENTRLKVIIIFLWFGITFYLVFRPFNFIYHNSVTFPAEGGLHFRSPSIAYIRDLPQQLNKMKKFSISTEVKPDYSDADRSGILFGYCVDHIDQNFLVMQKGGNLGFYLTDKRNVHNIWIRDIFEKRQSVWITITYDGRQISIFKNGTLQKLLPAKDLDFSYWNNAYPLVLANTGIGSIPWSGTIYSLDIFDNVVAISNSQQRDSIRNRENPILSLSFPHTQSNLKITLEDLSTTSIIIPAMFNPPAKGLIYNFRYLFGKWGWDFEDFIFNIIFFMPLGYFLRSLLEKSTGRYALSLWLTLITGLLLTILIETIQIFLPDRDTNVLDVVANTLGIIAGSFLFTISWIRRTIFLEDV